MVSPGLTGPEKKLLTSDPKGLKLVLLKARRCAEKPRSTGGVFYLGLFFFLRLLKNSGQHEPRARGNFNAFRRAKHLDSAI